MTNDYSRLKALPKRFPRVFSGDSTHSFEHGVGWTDLVTQLIQDIDTMLLSEPDAYMVVNQIKEKYGILHFYYQLYGAENDSTVDAIDALVDRMCDKSAYICERCGKPGKLNNCAVRCEAC